MQALAEFRYDVTSAISQGRREYQEDAVAADFPTGAGIGFAVVADGMGGHAAGDVASKIVVTEMFSELKLRSGDPAAMEAGVGDILRSAAFSANECVRYHTDTCPETEGMGATLVAPVMVANRLYWISVGDSLLYLYREGTLLRLNEDHSMVPQIDYLVSKGLLGEDEALRHPDRNCLTSVLAGQRIPKIDCPEEPVMLFENDIILVASDGLQFLEESEISDLMRLNAHRSSAEISACLMQDVAALADPDQDNISLCVIKVQRDAAVQASLSPPVPATLPAAVSPMRHKRKSVTVMASISRNKAAMTYRLTSENSA